MELKQFQRRVLKDLDAYLALLNETHNIKEAYTRLWTQQNVPVGLGGKQPYQDTLPGTPHACFKVPTGGGKTFLACASLRHVFDGMQAQSARVVAWLVPSNAILEQTVRALSNPQHPYRQWLERDFGSRVVVLTKDALLNGQNFSPSVVREQVVICVLSYDSLRSNRKDGRKMYQENSAMEPFIGQFTSPETLIENVDDTAAMQVLNQLSPIVVVDESHNAQSDLSVEMLRNLNPSFVLDLTATPKTNSNIISIVDARELKKENMVKLPVIVYNRNSKDDVLVDAIQLRGALEDKAKAEEAAGGRYIRPIVLFQAQPRGREQSETFEKLKAGLIQMGIPESEIAIKTSEINELRNIDLLSRDCPIRYIITVNALKEGWDCSFAYVLATLANKTSQVDVEQILGRVLRLPYVRNHGEPLLNMSYVLTCSADFRATLENIVKGLNRAGFSRDEFRVGIEMPEAEAPQTEPPQQEPMHTPENDGGEDYLDIDFAQVGERMQEAGQAAMVPTIASMTTAAQSIGQDYEREATQAKEAGIPLGEIASMKTISAMRPSFAKDARALNIPVFYRKSVATLFSQADQVRLTKESLSEGFMLRDKDTQIDFHLAEAEMYRFDIEEGGEAVPRYQRMHAREMQRIRQHFDTLPDEARIRNCVNAIFTQINRNDALESRDLRKYIERVVDNMDKDDLTALENAIPSYARRIQKKIEGLLDAHREKVFDQLLEVDEIACVPDYVLPPNIDPVDGISSIAKSLYESEGDINDFEYKVINAVAGLENVLWWHRVMERRPNSFYINGFINHYPDFLVMTKRGYLIALETKGEHLANEESRQKLRLGRKWAEKAGDSYRYYMVFDQLETGWEGALDFSGCLELIGKL